MTSVTHTSLEGDWGRDVVLYVGRKGCGLSLRRLGEGVGGMDYAAVSAAIKRMEERRGQDQKVATAIRRIVRKLNIET